MLPPENVTYQTYSSADRPRPAAFPRLQIFRDLLAALRRLDLDVGEILALVRQATALFANFTPEGLLAFIESILAAVEPGKPFSTRFAPLSTEAFREQVLQFQAKRETDALTAIGAALRIAA